VLLRSLSTMVLTGTQLKDCISTQTLSGEVDINRRSGFPQLDTSFCCNGGWGGPAMVVKSCCQQLS